MKGLLRDIYNNVLEFVRTFGAFQLFFLRIIRHSPRIVLRRPGLVIKQIHNTGALSLVIIMVCGFFVGGVLGLQGYSNLARFNAEDSVGTVVALALIKELGPVITALLFAGRAGTALFVAMPLLVAIFTCTGLFGAHVVAVDLLSVDVGAFWQQMQLSVDIKDIREGVLKSFVFGIVASLLAVWEGYNAIPTAEGVGRATTRTVVITAISVLILDFMITAVML
jgi:phospholipid/cholesterol/gamma-HCH transport system permease protein